MSTKNMEPSNLDDIVISGISGAFPNSENVKEFENNLLDGVYMVSSNNDVDQGWMRNINRFDHSFFGLTREQAENTNMSGRMLLEKTYEAILDSGYNPRHLKKKNIALICGIWDPTIEGDPIWKNKKLGTTLYIARSQFMIANRISYFLDINGPSFPTNTACSSSMYAMDHAIRYIRDGNCEGALVCATNLCFFGDDKFCDSYLISKQKSAPFDASANGYIRAEAAVAIFLQKRRHARRVYAHIVNSKISFDGFKKEGNFHPSVEQQKKLYEQFYSEIDVEPQHVSYVEAHCTSTQVGDVVECTSIEEFFCKNRNTPLKIGSVKSNMGHGEAAAFLCSVIKMIISFESGVIPANLNYNTPNPNIHGLLNGHLEVITKPIPLEGEYFALNSFGIGGANGHILMSPHTKIKTLSNQTISNIPQLVTCSGRTEQAVEVILNEVEKHWNDAEFIGLIHQIFSDDIGGHLNRGYILLNSNNDNIKSQMIYSGVKRPIWFVFSGMGSQWPTMGKSLMGIPIIAQSVQKNHRVLQSKGIDLIKILTSDDPQTFDNVLNSFIGIAAIQIALVDMFFALDINPDGIIGHSVGELGCAYADGCITAEEMMLVAYYRGLVSMECELICGKMAAVGLGYKELENIVPSTIDIACHNSSTSSTISGPAEDVLSFIKELEGKNIFAREVKTSNMAYHSRYISALGPKYISYIKQIIPDNRLRSEKWICTSAPEHEWSNNAVKYSSAEYYTNNLLHSVYFEEGCCHIPSHAIVVEIAPHGLLNTILKHSLPDTTDNIQLTMKNNNNIEYLFNALGRIYELGCSMKLDALYPPVEFPVSRSTPMISPLVKWQHEEQWDIGDANKKLNKSMSYLLNLSIYPSSNEHAFIKDHIIDDKNIYPGLGYLWLVLETMAQGMKKPVTELSVVFENVHLERVVTIPNDEKDPINFHINILQDLGHFEVLENNSKVATGNIKLLSHTKTETFAVPELKDDLFNSNGLPLNQKDFYKELRLRGYHYGDMFKQVICVRKAGMFGEILWSENFVTFMDSMAQLLVLHLDSRELIVPTFIQKLVINFEKHFEALKNSDKQEPRLPVIFYPYHNVLCSGGIQISGWKGHEITRQINHGAPVLEKYQFVPYISKEVMDISLAIRLCIHITLQNSNTFKVRTFELLDENHDPEATTMSAIILDALRNMPLIEPDINIITELKTEVETQLPEGITSSDKLPTDHSCLMIILSNMHDKLKMTESLLGALRDDGFIIVKQSSLYENFLKDLEFGVIFSRNISASEKILLLAKMSKNITHTTPTTIEIKNKSFSWISEVQKSLPSLQLDPSQKLILYAQKNPLNGILGFFNCLRKEHTEDLIRCFFIVDKNAENFSLQNPFYQLQFEKNLRQNVYKNDCWGTYCHLPLEPAKDIKTGHAFCTLEKHGDLTSFRWMQGSLDASQCRNADEKSVAYVYYSSLNFRDIMVAFRKISAIYLPWYSRLLESHVGIEFSGKDMNGARLMGILRHKGIATMTEMSPNATWKVPNNMTLEEAATIPVVYSTVIFAFFFTINLREGSKVLIHAGSGGVGQAAINICLHYKCEIFTTVGSAEKKEYIRKTFPQIPENHIGNSRDTSFKKMIMEQTEGKGVDVVLNSLSEEKLQASVRCVTIGGHFLEIGKFDMAMNNLMELGHFSNNISFHSIQLDLLLENDLLTIKFHEKVQEMIDQGIVKPLPVTVFETENVESAFRYMAAGKHIGKVVIKIREENDSKTKPTPILVKAKPHVLCKEYKSYLIIGGLGGFGMELADWLIIRGARNIILSSRTGVKNGYQSYRIQIWRSYGVNVVISTEDVTKETGVKNLLQIANSLGPVAAIFNLALILKDDNFMQQTEESFGIPVGPKVHATIHLDKFSRIMCPHLEHFIVFSSFVCGYGNANQTNYGYANSVMERVCEARQEDKLPALAVQWGAIGEVGFVANFAENASVTIGGTLQQKVKSCLETLDSFMRQGNPIVCSMVVAEKRHFGTDVIGIVANILGINNLKTINHTWTLPELGMDSLLGLEVKQVLESTFDKVFTQEELQNMTFAKLYCLKEKKDKGGITEASGEIKTSVEMFMDKDLLTESLQQIPFGQEEVVESLSHRNPLVFIFPGTEGIALAMQQFTKNLNIRAWCFQYHSEDIVGKSFEEMCQHFAELCLEKIEHHEEVHIIAYSSGGLVAIQVINILENMGKKCCVWLIDSSPSFAKTIVTEQLKMNELSNEKFLQNEVCNIVLRILLPGMAKKENIPYLEEADTWAAKKKLVFSMLPVSSVEENGNRLFDRVYNMIKQIPLYKISADKLKAFCVLIRCAEDLYDLDESYGLSEYFENPIQTHRVEGVNHNLILNYPHTAEIIMKYWK